MFSIAREQAVRDAELGRLREQIASMRAMLKQSHAMLSKLVAQEKALRRQLRDVQGTLARSDGLNIGNLKNVVVAFLLRVYGEADAEEHVKLARILVTVLQLTPEEVARIDARIKYYQASWWQRTLTLPHPDAGAAVGGGAEAAAAAENGGVLGYIVPSSVWHAFGY